MEIRVNKEPWNMCLSFLIFDRRDTTKSIVSASVLMQTVETGDLLPEPMKMSLEEAQSLMDNLWDCGIRPTEGPGSAGSLAATRYHLEDMRKLVFGAKP
jgi:hypothetical protein